MDMKTISELASFIGRAPTAFHAVEEMGSMLKEEGFAELEERKRWELEPGKGYYITRNQSSIIAFKVGDELSDYSFHVTASHSDSPGFKLKENAELEIKKKYTVLNTEGYGGMICSTWFDRPLSVAGRAIIKTEAGLITRLVDLDRDLLMIPSLAIHMDRSVNDGRKFNKQIDMLPVFSGEEKAPGAVRKLVAEELDVAPEDIYGMDLFLYNRTAPAVWGSDNEFFSCPRLDDLECAFASLKGFLSGANAKNVNVFACFDNEEVGSGTKQGAGSTFLFDVLWRINRALGKDEEDFYRAVAGSFMLSCDNAHAVHPNYKEKTDATNCVYMNEGIVVKSHAGQKYTSDAVSIAVMKAISKEADVPLQFFANRSDEAGGSTLGNIAMSQVSMNAVDIGLPQLAMHSAYETCGVKDAKYLIRAAKVFYDSHISTTGDGSFQIEK